MKYKENTRVIRVKTNQIFTIVGRRGRKRKIGHRFKRELMYQLKGSHPSLDLLVRESELDTLYRRVDLFTGNY